MRTAKIVCCPELVHFECIHVFTLEVDQVISMNAHELLNELKLPFVYMQETLMIRIIAHDVIFVQIVLLASD